MTPRKGPTFISPTEIADQNSSQFFMIHGFFSSRNAFLAQPNFRHIRRAKIEVLLRPSEFPYMPVLLLLLLGVGWGFCTRTCWQHGPHVVTHRH
jgi:hypothetical protein